MFKITREKIAPACTAQCTGHWTLRITVEPEDDNQEIDANICVFHKSAAAVPDGKDAFETVATLYDMETIPAKEEQEVEDTMPLMEQVPYYRTNTVTFICPNQCVAEEIWLTFKQRVKRLVNEYESSKKLNYKESVIV